MMRRQKNYCPTLSSWSVLVSPYLTLTFHEREKCKRVILPKRECEFTHNALVLGPIQSGQAINCVSVWLNDEPRSTFQIMNGLTARQDRRKSPRHSRPTPCVFTSHAALVGGWAGGIGRQSGRHYQRLLLLLFRIPRTCCDRRPQAFSSVPKVLIQLLTITYYFIGIVVASFAAATTQNKQTTMRLYEWTSNAKKQCQKCRIPQKLVVKLLLEDSWILFIRFAGERIQRVSCPFGDTK